MANIKITDLTAYGDPTSTDVLPIVDVGADVTKKVSIADLLKNAGSGTASAPGIAFDGDNTGIYRPGPDQVAISTNGAGRLFIDSLGRVGLGTSAPSVNLSVAASASGTRGGQVSIQNAASNASGNAATLLFYTSSSFSSSFPSAVIESIQGTDTDTSLSFRTYTGGVGSREAIRIDSSQRVGIGTTAPSEKLDVSGIDDVKVVIQTTSTGTGADAALRLKTGDYNWLLQTGNATFGALRFFDSTNSSERLRIDSSGRLLVGTVLSSGGSLLQVNDNRIRIALSKTPASASDTGTAGEICWDANYIYVCTATDTWKRAALSTW